MVHSRAPGSPGSPSTCELSSADFHIERFPLGAIFTITRDTHLNALNGEVWRGLEGCVAELELHGKRFLVITGQGERAFSAGSDLKDDVLSNWDRQGAKCERIRNLLLRLSRSPLFSVAAINGMAHGGGLELALACTMRIAVARARFSLPEIRLGLIPSYGGTQLLPAVIGRARAAELMLTGRMLDAPEALAWGLVSAVHDDRHGVMAQAMALASQVAGFSAEACSAIGRCLAVAGDPPTQETMDFEGRELTQLLGSPSSKDGIRAFLARQRDASAP